MLLGTRVAEAHQDAVAEVLRDRAAVTLHHLRTGAVVAGDDVAQVFGVAMRGQIGEPDEVHEHHRHLAALAEPAGGDRKSCRNRSGDRLQEAPPVAEVEPDLAKVSVGESVEHVTIDAMDREGVVEIGKVRRFQPDPKVIHRTEPHPCRCMPATHAANAGP